MEQFPRKRFLQADVPAEQTSMIEAEFENLDGPAKAAALEQWASTDAAGLRAHAEQSNAAELAERFGELQDEAALTKAELEALCVEKGVEVPSRATKDQLLELLHAHDTEAVEAPGTD